MTKTNATNTAESSSLSASKQKQLQKQSEQVDFINKLRKVRSLRVLLRDESKDDLEDFLLNITTVIEEILDEKKVAELQLEAERDAAKKIVEEMKEKGLNLDLIIELMKK